MLAHARFPAIPALDPFALVVADARSTAILALTHLPLVLTNFPSGRVLSLLLRAAAVGVSR